MRAERCSARAAASLLALLASSCAWLEPMAGPGPIESSESGLQWRDEVVPKEGAPVFTGMWVEIHYVASVRGGERFDASFDRGQPLRFRIGAGEVPAGLDQGLLGMRVGGRRTLVVPPELAFGAEGIPGSVPPDSFVVFEVELIAAEQP